MDKAHDKQFDVNGEAKYHESTGDKVKDVFEKIAGVGLDLAGPVADVLAPEAAPFVEMGTTLGSAALDATSGTKKPVMESESNKQAQGAMDHRWDDMQAYEKKEKQLTGKQKRSVGRQVVKRALARELVGRLMAREVQSW